MLFQWWKLWMLQNEAPRKVAKLWLTMDRPKQCSRLIEEDAGSISIGDLLSSVLLVEHSASISQSAAKPIYKTY